MTRIRMSAIDHRNLSLLLDGLPDGARAVLEELEEELVRAEVLPAEAMPTDVVIMGSRVVYEDVATGHVASVRLSYPSEADLASGRISVFAPVGAALLGLAVGQEITWPLPHGKERRIRVRQVSSDAA